MHRHRDRLLTAIACALCVTLAAAARADVTVSTGTTGPVAADGSAFTVTTTGTITGGGNGIEVSTGNSITTLTVQGAVDVTANAINGVGGSIGDVVNSGFINGQRALQGGLTIGTLTNSGTFQGSDSGIVLLATTGTVTNQAGGLINGATNDGVYVQTAVTNVANAGTIAGGTGSDDSGVHVDTGGNLGTLTNTGNITGFQAVRVWASSSMGSLVNSGTISGNSDGIAGTAASTITSIVNQAGGRISGASDGGIDGGGAAIGSIDNYGTIEAPYAVYTGGTIGSVTNRAGGIIRATASGTGQGFYNSGPVTTFVNEAGGLIESANGTGLRNNFRIDTLTNAGVVRNNGNNGMGFQNGGRGVVTVTNSGTFAGTLYGISKSGTLTTLTNTATGLIHGNDTGLYINQSGTTNLTNAGRITGGVNGIEGYLRLRGTYVNQSGGVISGTTNAGVALEDDAPVITNDAGGLIESAQGSGVRVGGYGASYVTGTIANAGRITGGTAGVRVENGALRKLANTGTIAYTGSGSGPAVMVGPGGVFGDATGAGGVALSSTGAGALIAGTIQNSGTVHHGFTVANQNVTVSAGGSAGRFTNGTLTVTDGNLTFTSGTTTLDAAASINGGSGTVFNDGTVRLLGIETVTGNYQQNAGGTTLMVLSGTGSGQYGQFGISGSASFAGNLGLDATALAGGLTTGQTFLLFEFASYTGGFGLLTLNGTPMTSLGGGMWGAGSVVATEIWTPTTMSLGIGSPSVPEIDPAGMASVLSLVVGSLGLAERRLRRGRRAG
ncbi:MAG: hypothetical protein KGQ61_10370 [Planctomycetes bacterium]|nr:hypothetical protein [Planctomycetota bacterium]